MAPGLSSVMDYHVYSGQSTLGEKVPPALIHITQVIVDSHAADVTVLICLLPLSARIFGCFDGTTEIPVSPIVQNDKKCIMHIFCVKTILGQSL